MCNPLFRGERLTFYTTITIPFIHGPPSSPPSPIHAHLLHVRGLVKERKDDHSCKDNRGVLTVYYAFEAVGVQPSSSVAGAQQQTAGGKTASGMCVCGGDVCWGEGEGGYRCVPTPCRGKKGIA